MEQEVFGSSLPLMVFQHQSAEKHPGHVIITLVTAKEVTLTLTTGLFLILTAKTVYCE